MLLIVGVVGAGVVGSPALLFLFVAAVAVGDVGGVGGGIIAAVVAAVVGVVGGVVAVDAAVAAAVAVVATHGGAFMV